WMMYREGPSAWRALGTGVSLGLAYLVRAEMLPYAALLTVFTLWRPVLFERRHAALVLSGFCLVASFWVGRNFLVFHKPVPTSTTGVFNLYAGIRWSLNHQKNGREPLYEPSPELGELE